jgi:predicted transcriptional regulator
MSERKLTIRLEPSDKAALTQMSEQFLAAWKSGKDQGEFLSFATAEQLFRVITPAKWGVLQTLQEQHDPVGVRPLARMLQRDPTAVLRDLTALEHEGIIEKTEDGKWFCPFSEIRTEFLLAHAA